MEEKITDTTRLVEEGIELQKLSRIEDRLTTEAPVRLTNAGIQGSCSVGAFTYFCPDGEFRNTDIGRFCSIARNVAIAPSEHPLDWVSTHPFQYNGIPWFDKHPNWPAYAGSNLEWDGRCLRTTIGNDVWIGRNVVIREGVTIGDGAVIGANSFVNEDIGPYCIAVGQPAKVVRKRFSDSLISELLRIGWWNLVPPENIKNSYNNIRSFIDTFDRDHRDGNNWPILSVMRYEILRSANGYHLNSV
ncbi:CatB-related O-acetyltransferase [Pseudovibrio sp. Alg231-02]|uniref:CatB-related O-acetyltransferase n=1 Tax=Pseudovibrio sp. Alg231-02 TaxID=1922223 RepID=UPI000D55973F|nr:CatB-related O-acetyltransferase [Pseudovibrio sp. Alg231-02]